MAMDSRLPAVILDTQLRNDPRKIAEIILELADDIESGKRDLSTLKDRPWYGRLVANNTADLADAMIRQNDTFSLFLHLIQGIITLNVANTAMLLKIQNELNTSEEVHGMTENKYVKMAKEFVSVSLNNALASKGRIDQQQEVIEELKARLIDEARCDEEQGKLIEGLQSAIVERKLADEKHSLLLHGLNKELQKQEHIDAEQAAMVAEQKARLVALQSELQAKKHALDYQSQLIDTEMKQIESLRADLSAKGKVDEQQTETITRQTKQLKTLYEQVRLQMGIDEDQSRLIHSLERNLVLKGQALELHQRQMAELQSVVASLTTDIDRVSEISINTDKQLKGLASSLSVIKRRVFASELMTRIFHRRLIVAASIYIAASLATILYLLLRVL